jgi:MarC family membrane protein
MPIEFLISALVTLLVVVDPVGLVPAFLALTEGLSAPSRRQVAFRAGLIAGAILIGAALIGDWLLRQLGITLPAFRIAGGLLLFAVAFEMVLGLRLKHTAKDAEQAVEEHVRNMAAFPLAIPLMAGPGAITATILLADPPAARRHRQRGDVASAGRDPGGARRAICGRRRARGVRVLARRRARTESRRPCRRVLRPRRPSPACAPGLRPASRSCHRNPRRRRHRRGCRAW